VIDPAKIHRLVQSKDVEERIRAVWELKKNFSILKVKKPAWDDMQRLTQDKDRDVSLGADDSVGAFY